MLILAGAPIGRVADVGTRLAEVLSAADVIAAEDTRRLARLAAELGLTVTGEVVSYFEGNEERRTDELIERIARGETVVLVTDAGMPSVSDPGYRLVSAAVQRDLPVTAVPGPSAVTTALAVSGLPVDRFCFEGFLPRKAGVRERALGALANEPRTMVFFESPHRTEAALLAMADVFTEQRRIALCRELTKTYEEVVRGTLAEVIDWVRAQSQGVRGEVTLVVEGTSGPSRNYQPADLRRMVDDVQAGGQSRKDAIAQVAADTGVRRREVFEAAHAQSNRMSP